MATPSAVQGETHTRHRGGAKMHQMDQQVTFGILVLQNTAWPALVERVRHYEALGFDTVWLADHFVEPWHPAGPWLECWATLAGLATQTTRIRLGPLVTHVTYRNPAL